MTIKEVKVAMTSAEEKTISRLQTRRKKLQKRLGGGMEEEQATPVVETPPSIPVAPVTVAPALPAVVQTPVLPPVQQPQQPQQSGGTAIKIQTTKRGMPVSGGASKILPTKRHMTVKRKPVMKFGGSSPTQPAGPLSPPPAQTSIQTPNSMGSILGPAGPVSPPPVTPTVSASLPSAVPTGPAGPMEQSVPSTTQPISEMSTGIPKGPAGPQTGGTMKRKTRRFKERKMSITVKRADITRKQKKSIRRKVKQMDIQEIRKILLAKGMISAKSNSPDKMLRAMMKEYLLLQSE